MTRSRTGRGGGVAGVIGAATVVGLYWVAGLVVVVALMALRVSWMRFFKVGLYLPMVAAIVLLRLCKKARGPFLEALELLLGLSLVFAVAFAVVFELVVLA